MGVSIRAIKPTTYLGTAEREEEGCRHIYTLNQTPIHYLTQFREGWYRFDKAGKIRISIPYSTFDEFRQAILKEVYGNADYDKFLKMVEAHMMPDGSPFVEFLYFVDNEGCFDYIVAVKLLADFIRLRDDVFKGLDEDFRELYDIYTRILLDCVTYRGVVYYC